MNVVYLIVIGCPRACPPSDKGRPLKKVSVLLARESSVFECHSEIIVIVFE